MENFHLGDIIDRILQGDARWRFWRSFPRYNAYFRSFLNDFAVREDNLCVNFIGTVNDILSDIHQSPYAEDEKDVLERGVYSYILKTAREMCIDGEKLFSTYVGSEDLFDMERIVVASSRLNAETFLNQILEQGMGCKVITFLYVFNISRIKEILDENVIYNNPELVNLTKDLAEAFNRMWYSCVKRYTDHHSSPGEQYIEMYWKLYDPILKGLTFSEIKSLDESGWDLALNSAEKYGNNVYYKKNFILRRDSEREVLKTKEGKIVRVREKIRKHKEKSYWEKYPERYKLYQEYKAKIKDIKRDISAIDKELQTLKDQKTSLDNKKSNIAGSISEKNRRIIRLQRKIFGRKAAAEEIKLITCEIAPLKIELEKVALEIQTLEKTIWEKQSNKNELPNDILYLKTLISDLKKEQYLCIYA